MFAQGRKDGWTNADHYYVTSLLRGGDKKGIRVEYGRTTFERIFNFKCVTLERILPVVCLGNLISKNVKNRNKNIYTLL